jgi:phenylpyruvate tautomerase PptA (4-oxalocrotonate tautomerase family)
MRAMPLLRVSVPETPSDPQGLLKSLSAELAGLLGKPESYMMATLQVAPMTMGGTGEACCLLEVDSLGTLSSQKTAELSKALCNAVSGALGTPPGRIYVRFTDVPRHLWGRQDGNFT